MSEDRLPERATSNEEHENRPGPNDVAKAHDPGKPNDSIVQSASLYLLARRILMTSLGAIALTFEETNDFIERLIERGEVAEHDISALVDDMAARAKGTLTNLPELPLLQRSDEKDEVAHLPEVQNGVSPPFASPGVLGARVEGILVRLNVPSRSDIDTLTRKIDLLSGKVDLLKSRETKPERNAETAQTAS